MQIFLLYSYKHVSAVQRIYKAAFRKVDYFASIKVFKIYQNQLYLESELCRKKIDEAIKVFKNGIDTKDRQLDRYRQVILLL